MSDSRGRPVQRPWYSCELRSTACKDMFRRFSRLRAGKATTVGQQHAFGPLGTLGPLGRPSTAFLQVGGWRDRDAGSTVAARSMSNRPRSVAVLGGGLTGLTTAWYLSGRNAHITLYESSDRLGGWLDTQVHSMTTDDGRHGLLHFERGARSVQTQSNTTKNDDMVLFEMIYDLDLVDKLRWTTKEDRLRRYIYYPDHLVDLTGPDWRSVPRAISSLCGLLWDLSREPLFTNVGKSVLGYFQDWLNWKKNRPRVLDDAWIRSRGGVDLSIGAYFTNMLGGNRDLVDNILSAVVHGVYGGDVWKLSMQSSIFAGRLFADMRGPIKPGHVMMRAQDIYLLNSLVRAPRDYHPGSATDKFLSFMDKIRHAEQLTFEGGLATLTDKLVENLLLKPNVTIKIGAPVTSLKLQGDRVKVEVAGKKDGVYDKVISTLLAQTTASLSEDPLPTLARQKATSIQLVNLWYKDRVLDKGTHGFGYLVPASSKNNPYGVLGVLFDSDRDAVFDARAPEDQCPLHDAAGLGGTKLTVMMGGHLWDDVPLAQWPDAHEAGALAKKALEDQLGIPKDAVAFSSSRRCVECIPQHQVGHFEAMERAHYELDAAFRGRLAVAGGSYTAPGVLSSVRAGRDVAFQTLGHFRFRESRNENLQLIKTVQWMPQYALGNGDIVGSVGDTGLARFLRVSRAVEWFDIDKATVPYRFGNPTRLACLRDGSGFRWETENVEAVQVSTNT